MKNKVCVIGGGAAGCVAAIAAAKNGGDVVLIEKNESPGKKILLTGNGKCNLSNLALRADAYASDSDFTLINSVLKRFDCDKLTEFFKEIGLTTVVKRDSYIYPFSESATSVVKVLERALTYYGVKVIYNERVKEIKKDNDAFGVLTYNGKKICADKVILCAGGKSYAKTGSNGDGAILAKNLRLPTVWDYPALTSLIVSEDAKTLAGLRADGEASLYIDGKAVMTERGQIQFTEYGLSGIPIFQLSTYISKKIGKGDKENILVKIRLYDCKDDLQILIDEAIRKYPQLALANAFAGLGYEKHLQYVLQQCKIDENVGCIEVSDADIAKVVDLLYESDFHISSVKGYDYCQVTGGGVDLSCLNENMESVSIPGLYVSGEMTDVTGRCGGYNLHWAFASGYIAGKHSAEAD